MTTTNNQQGESVDLDRLEALAKAATPGPWIDERNLGWAFPRTEVQAPNIGRNVAVLRNDQLDVSCTIGKAEREWANAAYIAAANPTTILALIAQARASQPSAASDAQPGADERALFEAWYGENYTTYLPRMREGKYAGEYVNSGTQMIWHAWQARAALATPAVQAGATVAAEEAFAWAAFAENGNVIIWSKRRSEVEPVAAKYGRPVTPVIALNVAAPASPATQPAAMDAAIDDGIPAGVYYNPDSRNFYDAKGVGMGWDFYIQWRECRDMFPKSRAAMSASVSEADGSGKGSEA